MSNPTKDFRLVRDPNCESPREYARGEICARKLYPNEYDGLLAEKQREGCVVFEFNNMCFTWLTLAKLASEFDGDRTTALACLESEMYAYDTWLQGECYGFEIYETVRCNYDHEHENVTDSCYGFIGFCDAENAAKAAMVAA